MTLVLLTIGFANGQGMKFGVKAGLLTSSYDGYSLHSKDKHNNYDDYYYDYDYNYYGNYYGYGGVGNSNTSNVGVYIGALVDFGLMDKVRLQPELNLSFAVDKDFGYVALNVPILVKYSFFKKFYAMAGPAFNYAIGGDDDQFSPSFDLGASYDIMPNFYVEVRGDIGVSGYLGHTVNAGVGYRL